MVTEYIGIESIVVSMDFLSLCIQHKAGGSLIKVLFRPDTNKRRQKIIGNAGIVAEFIDVLAESLYHQSPCTHRALC